jgi:hypothetical protein
MIRDIFYSSWRLSGLLPSLWRCGRIRLQRDAYSCSVSIKTMKDKTVSLMILNGELSDWYFLYPSGGADRGGVATPQIANDIAIGEDAFKNREDKPLAVTVLYHTIATKLQGAGFHTPQCQSGLSNWGGGRPPCCEQEPISFMAHKANCCWLRRSTVFRGDRRSRRGGHLASGQSGEACVNCRQHENNANPWLSRRLSRRH